MVSGARAPSKKDAAKTTAIVRMTSPLNATALKGLVPVSRKAISTL
jgi:hypothetical protein